MNAVVDNVVRHIQNLVRFDRVMCSEDYDRALDYVAGELTCPRAWVSWDVYPAGEAFWDWKVPASLDHWRDGRSDPHVRIPNDRPMKLLQVRVPGQVEEEILFVTHVCHPSPGANDNASGPAMMMELINYYTDNPPHFSLRFLFTVEYWGTVAFCARHESALSKTIAGVSIDMVGADQDVCGSTMIVDEIPHHLTSCLDLVFWHHLQIGARSGHYRAIGNPVTAFRCDFQYYTGGSDHYILNDSSVGIPSTALSTYPDRFYHTPDDTIDKISPQTLHLFLSAIVGGLADFGDVSEEGFGRTAQLVLHHLENVSHRLLLDAVASKKIPTREHVFRLTHTYRHAVARLESLATRHPAGLLGPSLAMLEARFVQVGKQFSLCTGEAFEYSEVHDRYRYRKLFKGPLSREALYGRITAGERSRIAEWLEDDRLFFHKVDAALNYSGHRGLTEIGWLLRMHYGGEPYESRLEWFFEVLQRHRLMAIEDA